MNHITYEYMNMNYYMNLEECHPQGTAFMANFRHFLSRISRYILWSMPPARKSPGAIIHFPDFKKSWPGRGLLQINLAKGRMGQICPRQGTEMDKKNQPFLETRARGARRVPWFGKKWNYEKKNKAQKIEISKDYLKFKPCDKILK